MWFQSSTLSTALWEQHRRRFHEGWETLFLDVWYVMRSFVFMFGSGTWITTASLCWSRNALKICPTPCWCWDWTGTVWTPFLPRPSSLITSNTCKWPIAYYTCERSKIWSFSLHMPPMHNISLAVIGRDLSRNRLRRIKSLTFNGLQTLRSLNMQRNGIVRLLDGAFWGLSKVEILWVTWCCDSSIQRANYICYV